MVKYMYRIDALKMIKMLPILENKTYLGEVRFLRGIFFFFFGFAQTY